MYVSHNNLTQEQEKEKKQTYRQAPTSTSPDYYSNNSKQQQQQQQYQQQPTPSDYRLGNVTSTTSTTANNNMTADIPSVWLWLADDETWERFDNQESSVIAKAISKGHKGAILDRGSTPYFLDLLRLTQTNAVSGRRRPIYNVQKGASWLVQDHQAALQLKGSNSNGDAWVSFSHKETLQLEDAFFEGSDFAVLNKDDGRSCYVDLAKWTLTCLATNANHFIKITPSTTGTSSSSGYKSPVTSRSSSPTSYMKKMAANDNATNKRTSTNTPAEDECCDRATLRAAKEEEQQQQQATTIIVNNDSNGGSNNSGMDNNSRRKCLASWRWHNDSNTWSDFDDEFTDSIEKSWATGAADMVYQKDQTQYYIDLQNLTQTNIDTGRVRPIQRVSQRKKSNSY